MRPTSPLAPPRPRRDQRRWVGVGVLALGLLACGVVFWRRGAARAPAAPVVAARGVSLAPAAIAPEAAVFARYAGSGSCRECHQAAYDRWRGSHHALAERPLEPAADGPAFAPPRTIRHGAQASEARRAGRQFELVTLGAARQRRPFSLARVIGVDPLRQFLVASPGGRYQVTELAADPRQGDWFDIFGAEDRQPGEWGHWTGRGMTWNSMCAACHNTRVRKNYRPEEDGYATRFVELGVGCEACHGPLGAHVAWQRRQHQPATAPDPTLRRLTKDQMLAVCGSCHARRSELTGDFQPGATFTDHHSLVIPDETDLYYPDGQVREEDYEYTSFLGSRMHAAGVRCGDCHEPHSSKTYAPDNQLCLRCHGPPIPPAPRIVAAKHSFHRAGERGDRCVDCHMPQTVYMQRHWRHDHGLTIPDPWLTKEHGVPNACNRCHQDQSVDWALAAAQKWYGARLERPTRVRAQWVAQGRAAQPGALEPLLRLARDERVALWRAVAVGLLKHWARQERVRTGLMTAAKDGDPLVRAVAARALEPAAELSDEAGQAALKRLLQDPDRSVRVEAAWALRAHLDTNSPAARDLGRSLLHNLDQPGGLLQMGVWELDRGNLDTALGRFRLALAWDPGSAPLHHALAVGLSLQGQAQAAAWELEVACRLAPRDAEYQFKLGLAWSEAGRPGDALRALETAVLLDSQYAQAWYNLGLAHAAAGRTEEALNTLLRAESLDASSSRIPYARATVLARLGRAAEARTAAGRALELQPGFPEALGLLDALRAGPQ